MSTGPGAARPRVIGNYQLFQQNIPGTAPNDLINNDGAPNGKFKSAAYPYIKQYVDLLLNNSIHYIIL